MSLERIRRAAVLTFAVALPVFTLVEVNYPQITPQGELALFALFGIALCFLKDHPRKRPALSLASDLLLALATVLVFGYVLIHNEPAFQGLWWDTASLGNRAGMERPLDLFVGAVGLVLVLESTRRALGLALPILSAIFLLYAKIGPVLPDWLLPHRGYDAERIIGQSFLQSQGVFGVALSVMFSYVFLFVVFGALLEATGATEFIIAFARRIFRGSPGGPAKVAVLGSGLMGSISGSAVANVATIGTFTIPLMKSSGFKPHVAAGVEAAASSGGALMPPVMGAGAYMMLEIIDPPVTYLGVIKAALIPAILYYFSLFMFVHFQAKRMHIGVAPMGQEELDSGRLRFEGLVFLSGLVTLMAFLLSGFSVFRAATLALGAVVITSSLHPRTRLNGKKILKVFTSSSFGGVSLICAAACVGIVLGVVTLTGIGTRLPVVIMSVAGDNLLLALIMIMISSLILGMGLPSAVCYLLMATLIGPVLGELGVIPLAAHLFIFYFGMMSMVTPPVALAAYAASSIAGSNILASSNAAFRVALVGFTLPFIFVFRPALLMLSPDGGPAPLTAIFVATTIAICGIVPLAAALAGFLVRPLSLGARAILLVASFCSLLPDPTPLLTRWGLSTLDFTGIVLFLLVLGYQWRGAARERAARPAAA
ncbi:MAG TPA: TRAP transporter fused permease subunit [Thermoanaerobaculia bacterium]|nr:TRAP transporter fused permease subunit [Thermoanaerobaculia bacterium]